MKGFAKLPVIVVALIGSMAAQAEPSPFKDNTVGFEVQRQIQSIIDQCYSKKFDFGKEFMPNDFFKTEYKNTLDKDVRPSLNISSGNLRMIASALVVAPTFPATVDVSKFMDLKTDRLEIDMSSLTPISSATNLTYVINCTSALKIALDQGFTFSWGGSAGVRNALTVQSNSSTASNLLISYGWYNSPIADALNSPFNPQHGAVNAALWNLYRRKDAIDKEKTYQVMSRFRGWFIATANTSSLSAEMGASASASINAILFNAKADADGNSKLSAGLSASSYNLFLDENGSKNPDIAMLDVALPEELNKKISKAALIVPPISEVTFIPGEPIPIKLSLPGMATICEDAGWIISASNSATVGLTEARINSAKGCEISAELNLSDTNSRTITISAEGANASVTIKNGNSVTSLSPRVEKTIKLRSVSNPTFAVVGQPRVVSVPGTQTYSITATISYSSLGIMRNLQANNLAITCDQNRSITISPPSFAVNERERSVELTIMGALPINIEASNCIIGLDLEADYTDTANKTRHLATRGMLTSFGFNFPKMQSL